MSPQADRDEQVSRLAIYERARDVAAGHAVAMAAVLGDLDRMSAGSAAPTEPVWPDLAADTDEARMQLLTGEAAYRAAAATIATPVPQSLVLFLGLTPALS